tara:strand:+ start:839 stop:2134 length:1296 start_codon:yes stop_codon:yes gene_type:complete
MVTKLITTNSDFKDQFKVFLSKDRSAGIDIVSVVSEILNKIKLDGDSSLISYTNTLDRNVLKIEDLLLSENESRDIIEDLEENIKNSLDVASLRIKEFHKKQIPKDLSYVDDSGTHLGYQWKPIETIGIYVPGGTASYPSTVLMNAIPAIVAGVKNIIMVSPASDGVLNASTIYAAKSLGIKEIYRIGGAQAVAALAYGTETIPKVDKIVGPGNAYVAEAKKQVFGSVGIDMLAGPSEIVVIADSMNDPRIIAADLLSQAEHDVSAQSILITNDKSLAEQVEEEVGMQLKSLTRSEIATKSWSDYGSIIITTSIDESVDISNQIAPEHLELSVQDARSYVEKVNHAGAVFVGTSTPEAIGDYLAGPSHVLPTSRTAKYSSGLSVFDFIKRTSIVECTQESLETIGNDARSIALNEGLDGHARSIEYRLSKK